MEPFALVDAQTRAELEDLLLRVRRVVEKAPKLSDVYDNRFVREAAVRA